MAAHFFFGCPAESPAGLARDILRTALEAGPFPAARSFIANHVESREAAAYLRDRVVATRQAHNLNQAGSIPAPAILAAA